MKNKIAEGKTMDWLNATASAVASGDPVLVGSVLCVATTDIAIGDTGALAMEGVYTLPKASADTFTQGAALNWDVSAGKLTTVAGSSGDLNRAAVAHSSASAGATSVQAKIGFLGVIA